MLHIQKHAAGTRQQILVCQSIDTAVRGRLIDDDNKLNKWLSNTKTGGLPGDLLLFDGMQVYITNK